MSQTTSIRKALNEANDQLNGMSPSAVADAEALLCFTLNCNSAFLATWPERTITQEQNQLYTQLIEQRVKGMPVAYLTGTREFWSIPLTVTNDTLIPRPETETLVEFVLRKHAGLENISAIDLGTGSGAIAIALAKEKPSWSIYASDISAEALEIARKNAALNDTSHIQYSLSNWFENIGKDNFDLVVSNPPYIAEKDPHLKQGDVRFEPELALKSGQEGMTAIKTIAQQARSHMKPNAWLVIEHGYDQKDRVYHCLKEFGYSSIEQENDLSGMPRVSAARFLP